MKYSKNRTVFNQSAVVSASCSKSPGVCHFSAEIPSIIMSSSEIEDGQTVEVTCTLPIDYRGGDCRLYRRKSRTPFKLQRATDYFCVFHLTSQELLGKKPVGSKIYLRCDYQLQQYTSVPSDMRSVTVWGKMNRSCLHCLLRLSAFEV